MTKFEDIMMRKVVLFMIVFASAFSARAQQDAMFSHYMFNTQSINPGYVGSREVLSVMSVIRSQWINFDGAPRTQTLSINSPLFNDQLGFGFSILNDKIGPIKSTNFALDLAYHLQVTQSGHKLSFGIKGGGNAFSSDFSMLDLDAGDPDQIDPSFSRDVRRKFLPNFGAGFYYNTTKWYAGLSIPNILEKEFDQSQRHYFAIAGALFEINRDIKLRPSLYLKMTKNAPVNLDFSAYAVFKDLFWLGGMFRTAMGRIIPTGKIGGGLGLMAGINLNENIAIGYSYDYSVGNTTFKYNGGSHEILLRYDFMFKKKDIIKSPRYF